MEQDTSAGRTYPFDLVDPDTGALILPRGHDPLDCAPPCVAQSLHEGQTVCLDFSPVRRPGGGVYPGDCTSESAATPQPCGRPFRGEYKTAAFRDVMEATAGGGVVFDLGCSNCELLARFPASALRIGIDISRHSLFDNEPNALDSGIGHLWVCDAARLPVQDNVVDVVMCCDVLEHLMEPGRMLHEIRRVLRPGGLLVATVPNLVHVGNRLSFLAGSGTGWELAQLLKLRSPLIPINGPRFPDQTLHLRWFTSSSLVRFAEECGFRMVRRFGCGPIATRLRLGRLLSTTALLTGFVARKP